MGEPRADGVEGLVDAQEKLAGWFCECEAEVFEEDPGVCQEEIADFDIDTECIESILADHPDDQAVVTCQADAFYDYYECFSSLGCDVLLDDGVVELDEDEGETPDEVASAVEQCEIDFEQAADACGDLSEGLAEEIDEACDLGGQESSPGSPGCGIDEDCD